MHRSKAYQNKFLEIQQINEQDLKIPKNIPIAIYLQEAEDSYHFAKSDSQILEEHGFSLQLLEELPLRATILRDAEASWTYHRKNKSDLKKEWEIKLSQAFELQSNLRSALKFALKEKPDLQKILSSIGKGRKHSELIQDLNTLALLGRDNPEPLSKIKFNYELIEEAAELSRELPELLATIYRDEKANNNFLMIRNQAYTHLKELVDEIYTLGQYIFRKDKKRLKAYSSNYLRKIRNRTTKYYKTGYGK